jgi:UDP-3-O-[3-hydroxymyristoyl] N-acetylglucosamine deacetylase
MPVDLGRVESRNSTTLLGPEFKVQTVEHLLAACWALGLDSLVVELDADEIPIMDGSAGPFVEALESAGERSLGRSTPAFEVARAFSLEDRDASILFEPPDPAGAPLELSYTIEYAHPSIGRQSLTLPVDRGVFSREVAPARTFGFLKDVEALHAQGLALGASLANTVVLDAAGIVNPPLRFPDEFVRHKHLDLIGDLALLGRPLRGRVTAARAGHRLHLQAVRHLLDHPDLRVEV